MQLLNEVKVDSIATITGVTIAASVQLKTLDAAMRKLMKSMSLHLGGFISITPYVFGKLWRY